MFSRLHRLIGRFALTAFLALATQLAYAAQLCHSVATWNMAAGGLAHSSSHVGEAASVDLASLPCCDAATVHPSTCIGNPADIAAAAPAATPVPALAPPASARPIIALVSEPTGRRLIPAASVGPPLPAYILFRRFLS